MPWEIMRNSNTNLKNNISSKSWDLNSSTQNCLKNNIAFKLFWVIFSTPHIATQTNSTMFQILTIYKIEKKKHKSTRINHVYDC